MSGCALKKIRRRLCDIFGKSSQDITKADIRDAFELMNDASAAADIALPYARFIARKIGLDSQKAVVEGPVKRLERIFEKAIGKLGGELEKVPDIGRLRVLVDCADNIIDLRRMYLDKYGRFTKIHPSNKITVIEFQDNFFEPSSTGRIAIHIGLEISLSGGRKVPFEIQVIHKDMVETEKLTRNSYLRSCEIERRAKGENRPLTTQEMEIVEAYKESSRQRYLADALNLGLYDLRHPRFQNKHAIEQIRLVA